MKKIPESSLPDDAIEAPTITKIDPNDTTEQTISGRRNNVTAETLKRLPLEEEQSLD